MVEKNSAYQKEKAVFQTKNGLFVFWQARRDSNPQHPDLESGALPIRATGLWRLNPIEMHYIH
jgi:hypothetical protein